MPNGVLGALSWHRNNRELAFSMASARSTSDVYSLDATTGAVTRWTESELGGLVASDLSEPELIRWKSFDGLEISGFYYQAAGALHRQASGDHQHPRRPRGPVAADRSSGATTTSSTSSASSIIYPNVRGSIGYGKTFVGLDNGMKREDSVKDIGALLDWIAHAAGARCHARDGHRRQLRRLHDARRVDDVQRAALRAAVDVVGISNFNTFLKNTESYRRDLRRVEYGDERDPKMAAFFDKIAPLNNAQKITQPLFVVQGGNDPRVPLSEAEQMVERVKQNGKPVWYLMAKDEGHGFAKKGNADFQFYATVMFVRRYLLGTGAGRVEPALTVCRWSATQRLSAEAGSPKPLCKLAPAKLRRPADFDSRDGYRSEARERIDRAARRRRARGGGDEPRRSERRERAGRTRAEPAGSARISGRIGSDAQAPATSPSATSDRPWRSTIPSTRERGAPSARRTPNSRRRCCTA